MTKHSMLGIWIGRLFFIGLFIAYVAAIDVALDGVNSQMARLATYVFSLGE